MQLSLGLNVPLQPLAITCTSTDCGNGLHCFRQSQKVMESNPDRQCRACGAKLVDWDRVHARNLAYAAYTLRALKYELIRHHNWHIEIDQKAVDHARCKGKAGMRLAAERRLQKSIGPAQPSFDGRQTPKHGRALFYAQHATATCCRKCLLEWYGISPGRELTAEELTYFTELVMLYVDERLPFLTEHGEKVPRRGGAKTPVGSKEAWGSAQP